MTCGQCERELFGDKCVCGWQVPRLEVPKRSWIYRECEGCTTMIVRQPHEEYARYCKWCKAKGVTTTRRIVTEPVGECLTKEEFGLTLYEAIKINAGRLQCEKKGDLTKAKELQSQLQPLLEGLAPNDVRRILAMT
jgi:hypothetical protein